MPEYVKDIDLEQLYTRSLCNAGHHLQSIGKSLTLRPVATGAPPKWESQSVGFSRPSNPPSPLGVHTSHTFAERPQCSPRSPLLGPLISCHFLGTTGIQKPSAGDMGCVEASLGFQKPCGPGHRMMPYCSVIAYGFCCYATRKTSWDTINLLCNDRVSQAEHDTIFHQASGVPPTGRYARL